MNKYEGTTPYTQTYSNFRLACITQEYHEKTCGYWYIVTAGAMSHTAFTTAEELREWAGQRALVITDTLPEERGTFKTMRINGTYSVSSYLDVEAFKAITPLLKIAKLDNARYTLGKITQDETGVRTVHHLNCNIKERVEFPYFDVRDRKPYIKQMIEEAPDTQERSEEPVTNTYSQIWLQCYDKDMQERRGYWYSIAGHTGLQTAQQVKTWTAQRGLVIKGELPERGNIYGLYLLGWFKVATHNSIKAFEAITPLLKIAHLDNGNYTLGKITRDEDGVRTIHHLSCNVKSRVVFPYADTRNGLEWIQKLIEQSPDTRAVLAEQTRVKIIASTNSTEYGLLATIVNVELSDELGEIYAVHLDGDEPGSVTFYSYREVEPID